MGSWLPTISRLRWISWREAQQLHAQCPAAIDALVKTRDMRQTIRAHQRSDDARAPSQRRGLQPPVDVRQRHAHIVVITQRRTDFARRNGFGDFALWRRNAKPLADKRQYQQFAGQCRADRVARHANDGDSRRHADDDRMTRTHRQPMRENVAQRRYGCRAEVVRARRRPRQQQDQVGRFVQRRIAARPSTPPHHRQRCP